MKHVFAIVLFAIVAGLAACEMASVGGIKSIPETVRKQLGLPEGGAVVAKIEASGIDAADFKAKVAHAVEDAKAKVADVAEKAVEAAQPDRSADVTPAATESAPEQVAAGEDIAPPSTPPGTTNFYGGSTDSAVAGWAAEAAMNPDYDVAAAPAAEPLATEAPAPEAPAAEQPAGERSAEAETIEPSDDAAAAAQQDAATPAEAPAAAVEEPAPVSLGGIGTTSYFGFADKPDADQPWAAAAAANPDYAAETDPPSAPAEAATAVASDATDAPVSEPATQSSGPTGQTSFFGLAKMPDADQPWAAPAAPNTDYAAEAAEPVTAPEPSAPADDAVSNEPAVPSAEPSVTEAPSPADESAPVSLGGIGTTSYFGFADKPDGDQSWGAAAKGNPDYAADVQSPPAAASATPQAVEACRDALNAEAQTGGLQFGLTRWDISPDNYGSLDKLAKLAKDCGGVIIEVRGHTDNTGKPQSNQTLSDLRAKAVVTYLTKAGVPLSKMKAIGFGEGKPIGDNATAEGRRQNRRIEFVVTGN